MKQNKGDWTDAVRRSLSEAEPPLPRGGWERLERELGRTAPEVSGTPSKRVWLKFAAAAAAVLVCVSIGFRVVRMDKNVLKRVVLVPEAAVSEQIADAGESTAPVSDDLSLLREPASQPVPEGRISESRRPGKAETLRETVEKTDVPVKQMEVRTDEEPDIWSGVVSQRQERAVKTGSTYQTVDYDGLFAQAEPPKRRGGSVAFAAGGFVIPAGGGTMTEPGMLIMTSKGAARLSDAYTEFSYKHKQPLSFGLTFRKELGYGLSAESGLIYTLLRSDVAVPGGIRDVRQTLHMLGIPLRVNWEFLRRGRFSLYVGAGGMIEKCVSARFGGDRVKERGVQWSLFGAVGAQYRLGKTVGLYFEPSISHYLTETTLRTPYTDSEVNLNLQLGVRFTY